VLKRIVVAASIIDKRILLIRGQKVLLSGDLADLYGVTPKALMQAVRRNLTRFPRDFMFRLTSVESRSVTAHVLGLRSQFVTLEKGRHLKYPPYAFTEQGVAMLSSVLRSKRAIQMNIAIMRAFVRLREVLAAHKDLAQKLAELEKKYESHDRQIHGIFEAIRELMRPPEKASRRIGF
jgi:hypothetical protein